MKAQAAITQVRKKKTGKASSRAAMSQLHRSTNSLENQKESVRNDAKRAIQRRDGQRKAEAPPDVRHSSQSQTHRRKKGTLIKPKLH